MLVFATFAVLVVATSLLRGPRYFARTRDEWVVDGAGLVAQGIVVPLLETFAIVALLAAVAQRFRGSVELPFAAAFALNFVVIDYFYYWNHRLLHGPLWRWHAVHHTARRLDVLVTARNTLWTPLLIVYVWLNAVALFLLRDPTGFLLGMSVTAALDLWRHSPLRAPRFVSALLITPHEHAWHHSSERTEVNFGANFSLWDRVHGTFAGDLSAPRSLGVDGAGSGLRQLFAGVGRDARRLRAGRPLSTSFLGRVLTFFPALVIALTVACVGAAIATRSPVWLAGVVFCIYALPLLVFRAISVFVPLREQRTYLDGTRYSPWWGSHQLQRLYIALPQLESVLQLIPGAFSVWLRLWGSRIGKRVYWTPRVEIADRSMLDVGDDVVFGHKVECFAHAIKPSQRGRLILLVRKITIGKGVFLGAGVRIGPGVRVDDGTFVPTLTDLYIGAKLEEAVPA